MGVSWDSNSCWRLPVIVNSWFYALLEHRIKLLVLINVSLFIMVLRICNQWRIRISMHIFVINWDISAFLCTKVILIQLPIHLILSNLCHALAYYLSIDPLRVGILDVCSCIVFILPSLNSLVDWSATILILILLGSVYINWIFLIVEFIELNFQTLSCDRTIKWNHINKFFLRSIVLSEMLILFRYLSATRPWFLSSLVHRRTAFVVNTSILYSHDIAISS